MSRVQISDFTICRHGLTSAFENIIARGQKYILCFAFHNPKHTSLFCHAIVKLQISSSTFIISNQYWV